MCSFALLASSAVIMLVTWQGFEPCYEQCKNLTQQVAACAAETRIRRNALVMLSMHPGVS
jgi:hypothetical protein